MDRRSWLRSAGLSATGMAGVVGLSSGESRKSSASGLSAVWVHGTSVQVEDQDALTGTQRVGWGALFSGKPKAFTWFHISFATPVLVDDARPHLERVFVFYKTNGASIRNLHVYDGPRRINVFDGLMLQGDRSGGIVPVNTWTFAPPLPVLFALGISVGVQFDVGFDSPVTTEILFTAAGADFRFGLSGVIRNSIDQRQRVRVTSP